MVATGVQQKKLCEEKNEYDMNTVYAHHGIQKMHDGNDFGNLLGNCLQIFKDENPFSYASITSLLMSNLWSYGLHLRHIMSANIQIRVW